MPFVQFLIFRKFYLVATMRPCFRFGDFLFLSSAHSFKRGEGIKPIGKVSVINGAIVFCHFQGRMSQQLLEGKGVSSAVQQILSGKGMSEHVDGSLFNASPVIIPNDSVPQSVLRHHFPMLCAKQVVRLFACSDPHVFFQTQGKGRAQGDDLNSAGLSVAENDLLTVKVNVPVLDIPNS